MTKQNFARIATQYAQDVVNGDILACKWVVLACQRHLNDLEKSKTADFAYRFDEKKAARIVRFTQNLKHTKGKWAGQNIELEPWQIFILASVFGWVDKKTGLRRYRKCLIIVPRKNGKSLFAAAVGLYMLVADGEAGAEIYAGATSEKQALEVFTPARLMAQRQDFKSYYQVDIQKKNINVLKTASRFEPLIGKPGDGASPSCSIHDEYHEHPTDEQVDTMETGMGAREQPLLFIITTAGDNLAGPCFAMKQDVENILEGHFENDEFFGIIFTVDDGDDWTSEDALVKANPNYGISVGAEFLKSRQRDAIASARKQGIFKTKHLNLWVSARSAFFNMQKWKECTRDIKLDDYRGRDCYVGLDLASKKDIAALEMLFPVSDDEYVRFGKYYLPEGTVNAPENEHYRTWVREGYITETPGDITDFNYIEDDIVEIASMFQVVNLAYDPFQATMLVANLMNRNLPVVEYKQTVLNMSEPMKTLEALTLAQKIHHDGCPVMSWQMSNVTARVDKKDNVYPNKDRAENKIDNPGALIMALGCLIVDQATGGGSSVYEERDMLWI